MNLNCKILHVEDDDNDSLFFQRALSRLNFEGAYRRVASVDEAMDYLKGAGEFENRRIFPLPDVVVLDSALPGAKSGVDLVKWLTTDPQFANVAKVVLTGGMALATQHELLSHGVAGILLKGMDMVDMALAVESVLVKCAR